MVVAAGDAFGHGDQYAGLRVNLEFVSANPTGPLHAGGGRWVAVGDAIANLLAAQGAVVHREYYLNDAGNQLDTFGASLNARYTGTPCPRTATRARTWWRSRRDARRARRRGDAEEAREWGLRDVVEQLRTTSGASACTSTRGSRSARCTSAARSAPCSTRSGRAGAPYEKDGATWLGAEDLGDQRDRVLVKSDGNTTYLLNDLAYHRDKLERGWEHLIDIWGADHHGQVKSVQVGMQALGVGTADAPEPEVILGQFVTLVRDGETVRLSKRTGNDHHARRHPRRGRSRRRPPHVPAAEHRHRADLRPRRRHVAVDGEPRVLRAVRARAGRVDRAEGGRARRHAAAARHGRSRPLVHERELDLLRALAEYPDARRALGDAARAAPRHHLGARLRVAVPRLLPGLSGDHRRRRAHPGAALAHRGVPRRARRRARHPRRERARGDGAARRRRDDEPDAGQPA